MSVKIEGLGEGIMGTARIRASMGPNIMRELAAVSRHFAARVRLNTPFDKGDLRKSVEETVPVRIGNVYIAGVTVVGRDYALEVHDNPSRLGYGMTIKAENLVRQPEGGPADHYVERVAVHHHRLWKEEISNSLWRGIQKEMKA